MQLLAINGSPRGKKSNSRIILKSITSGAESVENWRTDTIYLNQVSSYEERIASITIADVILLIFPLYTDSMPGIVMKFIEVLQNNRECIAQKKIGFIIQSGFPERHHSVFIQKYFIKLAQKLDCCYIGSAILGGIEGIQNSSKEEFEEYDILFTEIGRMIVSEGKIEEEMFDSIKGPYKFPRWVAFLFKYIMKLKKGQSFWDNQLKTNNAYEQRFERPYE
ncbi:hypothetical protein NEF87_002014 [Candidatus Lokiarchaeum ossiferum]|uniref:Flavodoxin-like fold domain-containing protein n=1 Tax=Candidatus Lokiarchaeum ossiferum TaxID=2951803 RepID=A0ABY6HQE3_9ARCH|nr:hypothetical protein NEF87_002014 [Candidatus Lokiarchaeum sp. B-35]